MERIVGLDNYLITEDGRVFSKTRNRFLKCRLSGPKWAQYYALFYAKKNYKLHRLVAIAFVPNPYNKKYVNHKDGNKLNNHYKNLEWATHPENMDHAGKTRLMSHGENHTFHKLTDHQVQQIRFRVSTGECQKDLAKEFGVNPSVISKIHHIKTRKYASLKG